MSVVARAGVRGQVAAVLVTTVALTLALVPNRHVALWPATALAALLGLSAALVTAAPGLRAQLTLRPRALAQGVLGGVIMAVVTHGLYPLVTAVVPGVAAEAGALYGRLDSPPGHVAAVPVVVLVVVAEELVWRGIAYPELARRHGRRVALPLSTLIYALPQLGSGSWLLPLLALVCGGVWTAQRAHAGNLTVPCLTHVTWDLLVLVAFPLASPQL